MSQLERLKSLAFYLPQFHPIAENDRWWSPGFTEWTNVTRGRPRFPGHYQPHRPERLGYYDLRLPEVREAQAALARGHGVHGFVYYHYWFHGRRLLERPFDEVLRSGSPDLPFALCWANEPWTRAWDGDTREVLVEQRYSRADDLAHIEALRPALSDPRAITVDGCPLLVVYRASDLPEPAATAETWRRAATDWGLPGLHLARVESQPGESGDPRAIGFDTAVQFQPRWSDVIDASVRWRLRRRLLQGRRGSADHVVPYERVARQAREAEPPAYPRWPGVAPGWDNTVRRREGAVVLHDARPEQFQEWVRSAAQRALETSRGDALVFVNAWNEWAEGCHLEPDERWGTAFLEAHAAALGELA